MLMRLNRDLSISHHIFLVRIYVLFFARTNVCVLGLIMVSSTFMTCRLVYRINIHSLLKHFLTWQQLAPASGSILLTRCLPSHPTCRKKLSSWYCHQSLMSGCLFCVNNIPQYCTAFLCFILVFTKVISTCCHIPVARNFADVISVFNVSRMLMYWLMYTLCPNKKYTV